MYYYLAQHLITDEVSFLDRKTETVKRGTIRAVHFTGTAVSYTVEAPNDYHSGTNQSIIMESQIISE